jgi:hypothetical protein
LRCEGVGEAFQPLERIVRLEQRLLDVELERQQLDQTSADPRGVV